jgi:hypothetical protein
MGQAQSGAPGADVAPGSVETEASHDVQAAAVGAAGKGAPVCESDAPSRVEQEWVPDTIWASSHDMGASSQPSISGLMLASLTPGPICATQLEGLDGAEAMRLALAEPLHWRRELARRMWSEPQEANQLLLRLAAAADSVDQALAGDLRAIATLLLSKAGGARAASSVPEELTAAALAMDYSRVDIINCLAMVSVRHTLDASQLPVSTRANQ